MGSIIWDLFKKQRTQEITEEEWSVLAGGEELPPQWFRVVMLSLGAAYPDIDIRPANCIAYWLGLKLHSDSVKKQAVELAPLCSRSRCPTAYETQLMAEAIVRAGYRAVRRVAQEWHDSKFEASETMESPTPPWFMREVEREASESTTWRPSDGVTKGRC